MGVEQYSLRSFYKKSRRAAEKRRTATDAHSVALEVRDKLLASYPHVPMRLLLRHSFILALSLYFANAAADIVGESFKEELVLRPERDGRVVSSFAFTTLLSGVHPRDPGSLEVEDGIASK